MNIQLVGVDEAEKSVLRQLLELYIYDFSEYDQADVNQHGLYGYAYLDLYWTQEARHPFFIVVDGKLAGFVLVSDHCRVLDGRNARSISEFFVMRKHRRKGVGKLVAWQIFDLFPGQWEVGQYDKNQAAKIFWEQVIGAYTNGNFTKEQVITDGWAGQVLIFENRSIVAHGSAK